MKQRRWGKLYRLILKYNMKKGNVIIPSKNIFSGIQKFTTLDDLGFISAILFTGGCNFRCLYCHNPNFVIPKKVKFMPQQLITDFLEKRKDILDSIIICGGEPTIHSNLLEWIEYIKSLHYRIKLDTNATNTSIFRKIIDDSRVDFIAIDYKSSLKNYSKIIQKNFDSNIVLNNLKYLIDSKMDYEIRTTIHPDLHTKSEIFEMIHELKTIGVKNYFLQLFKMPQETVGIIEDKQFEKGFFDEIKIELENNFESSGIRNEE